MAGAIALRGSFSVGPERSLNRPNAMSSPGTPGSDGREHEPVVLVANARMPSLRAQSLQVAQATTAFARAGAAATLLYARRHGTEELAAQELWKHYGVRDSGGAEAQSVPCFDWIDRSPRRLQFVPARLQELSFAARAARLVQRDYSGARVLSRELETARALRRRPGVFIELHRVPGGRLRRRWLIQAAASCAGIVAISGGVREDLVGLGVDPESILVEHDAYDPDRYGEPPRKAAARERLGLDPDARIVVYTGGLLRWKGVDVLVEAAKQLAGDVQVVIAGGMEADVERLRIRAAGVENVRIDGFRPAELVPFYLAAGDVGVVPNRAKPAISARYTSPLKVFEATAVGLPLVVSDLPSMRDILSEQRATFVTPEDPDPLARGLMQVLDSAERLSEMKAAQLSAAEGCTWDARARRILDWMETRA